ncbi:alpha/beta hydrolase [Uliginosibacterium sediminicola]|uniref:Dienelactone hydrolase family protein n=1 Tax=Uliginosibacterium sediminicola TaxID=2024550 RepID=A0ABU9Z0D7_9RHOO
MNFHYLYRPAVRPPGTASAKPAPLLVLLHGMGANEEDLFGLAPHFDAQFAVLSIRAPIEIQPGYYRWYLRQDTPSGPVYDGREVLESRSFLIAAIESAVREFDIDPQRVYVLGFSQGAAMALSLVFTAPQLIQGAISIAGRVLDAIEPLHCEAAALAHLSVLLLHGTQDGAVPFEQSELAARMLSERGVRHALHAYNAGHTVTPGMLREAKEYLAGVLRG